MRFRINYQFFVPFFSLIVVLGVGSFVYKELFPDYKTYQTVYKDIEKIRASYTGEKPAPFSTGIKQILLPNENQGPEIIDRCISCHVAVDLPHFSPLRVAHDVNGNPVYDAEGKPLLEPNSEYVWNGLEKLKTRIIDGREVDMTKVLQMHPLIGSEIRPFQYHPMEEYGCTSCHSGNGRALVAKRAHGPLYDEDYEPAYTTFKPQFLEKDEKNDPPFAHMYNDKPGHDLVFQTTPLLAGDLLVAKCVQCHQSASSEVSASIDKLSYFTDQKKEQIKRIQEGIENDKEALLSLLTLTRTLVEKGRDETINWLQKELENYHLTSTELDAYTEQLSFINAHEEPLFVIRGEISRLIGSEEKADELMLDATDSDKIPQLAAIFLTKNLEGTIAEKETSLQREKATLTRFKRSTEPLKVAAQDTILVQQMGTEVDKLITPYNRGKELFISQACYACHRIAGFSRSSVGPELTQAGLSYPWYIKESIVWPQADLPSSTMPNFRLDHEELSALMTFLMAQTGHIKAISEVDYQISLKEWEGGAKMPWEKPVSPTAIDNIRQGMLVFVSEGCAACHKLEGFESNIGLAKGDKEWFYNLIPEQSPGSKIAQVVKEKAAEIDTHIIDGVRKDGIIEEVEETFPGLVEGFYSNFKYAHRALDTAEQKERLKRVLMVYITLYGMGRDIAPHLNWSGVYRDDEWLMGHFHNPSAYTARSIMPVVPFDDSKFFMLTHMLHILGQKNRDSLREIWNEQGFNPPLAYELLCSSCHGVNRQGNGAIAEWIYPIPKNLRNPVFLRNLTKKRAIESITHGVHGTPMPPWGESALVKDSAPVLTQMEISQLVDWLYQGLPESTRSEIKEDYEKWNYAPANVIKEMEKEHDMLKPVPKKGNLVEDYFRSKPNPLSGPDKNLYYIREKYYTQNNLKDAERYFVVNCAPCHGKEGAGTGLRSTSMVEAKPRMLTNLPWVRTRDDIRLLRSIKYGVPGTSMIPWGDQTTAAQRMQLVIFIRELTRNQLMREDLQVILYDVFDRKIPAIEQSRAKEYVELERSEDTLRKVQEKLYETTDLAPETAGELYLKISELKKEIAQRKALDDLYVQLIFSIKEEKDIFQSIGSQLVGVKLPEKLIKDYFDLIRSYDHGNFELDFLLKGLDEKIAQFHEEIGIEESKIRSPERTKAIQDLMEEQGTYINLKTKLLLQLANAKKVHTQQRDIYDRLQRQTR